MVRWGLAVAAAAVFGVAIAWLTISRSPTEIAGPPVTSDASPNPSTATNSPEAAGDVPARSSRSSPVEPAESGAAPRFEDIADKVGIDFTFERGETGEYWPVEPVGGGAGWLDYDGDGRIDLVMTSGAKLPVDPDKRFIASRLFRNHGAEQFEDVTQVSGLLSRGYGQGLASADYDNDGFPDLYLTAYGPCSLYHNNGDGTFADVTKQAGTPGGEWNTGACFADFDRDGVLDLYVANYFHFDTVNYPACRSHYGDKEYCGPAVSPPLADFLYRGLGDGTFEDASDSFGTPQPRGHSFGGVAADLDNDGWTDLYVANDYMPNFLFHNLGATAGKGLRFEEVAYQRGAAVSGTGVPQASMGIACGDIDRNGFADLGLSHFTMEYFTLYLNEGPKGFVDSSYQLGLAGITGPTMGWGTGFFDYDNNGWLDLFIANGHINQTPKKEQPYEMKPHLFRNRRGSRFEEVTASAGAYFESASIARGVAFGDLNNDGRTDLAVVHHHKPAALLLNQTKADPSALIELIGTRSNRDGINAKLRFYFPDEEATKDEVVVSHEVISGDSFLSSNDRRVQIGLGKAGRAIRWEVQWPSGQQDSYGELVGGTRWIVREGAPLLPLK